MKESLFQKSLILWKCTAISGITFRTRNIQNGQESRIWFLEIRATRSFVLWFDFYQSARPKKQQSHWKLTEHVAMFFFNSPIWWIFGSILPEMMSYGWCDLDVLMSPNPVRRCVNDLCNILAWFYSPWDMFLSEKRMSACSVILKSSLRSLAG